MGKNAFIELLVPSMRSTAIERGTYSEATLEIAVLNARERQNMSVVKTYGEVVLMILTGSSFGSCVTLSRLALCLSHAAFCAKTLSQAFADRTDFGSCPNLSQAFVCSVKSLVTAFLPFAKASYINFSSSCYMG